MGSISTCRALAHCQGLLLAVSLLSHWCLPTSAQFAVVSANVVEGRDVYLRLRNKPVNATGFRWFRGEGETNATKIMGVFMKKGKFEIGGSHRNRETLFRDGTLRITDTIFSDTGAFTAVAYLANSTKVIATGRLTVYQPLRIPLLLISNMTFSGNESTVDLTCYENGISIQWWFNGSYLQLNERRKLSKDNITLTIDPVKKEDTGIYQCECSNPTGSLKSWPVEIR